ncbi:MAG: 30S ribosomal protein S17 [Gemmatimonadetes bacterium]|nr:30S ribosomal protein S17 [Gemmatimonadota bacterium]
MNDATKPVEARSNDRKMRIGTVVSDKQSKTVVVEVQRQVEHAEYGKRITRTKKYYAHDEKRECHVGDTVRIIETRPLSKLKRWRVVELIERAR